MPKLVNVRVSSVDSELEFAIHPSTTGKQLFDQVVKTIGVREVWYFGLQYTDSRGEVTWISLNKKIMQHDYVKDQMPLQFRFRVKFYPEDASNELIQEITQRLFYQEVKDTILRDEVYCSPETAVLLASYAAQIKFGDFRKEEHSAGFLFGSGKENNSTTDSAKTNGDGSHANGVSNLSDWLPTRVFDQHNFTNEQWAEKILAWWAEHSGMMRDDAMIEYLKIAQDLETYGVTYYEIKNKKGTDLWLGIDALGLNIYERGDRLTPRVGFPWSEIKHVAFSDKKFSIESIDKKSPKFIFFAARARINKRILALSMGNHELYMRRRRPESIEIQQMRMQAAEERSARVRDRDIYNRERKAREDIERQRKDLEAQLREFEARAAAANREMVETSERLRLLEEKYAAALREREELEEARRHAEQLHTQLMEEVSMEQEQKRQLLEEYERARMAADQKQAVVHAKEAELSSTKVELEDLRRELAQRSVAAISVGDTPSADFVSGNDGNDPTDVGEHEQAGEAHLEMAMVNGVVPEPELGRETAISSDSRLQERLMQLGDELRANRDNTNVSHTDRLHDENVKVGRDKFKTLKQIRQGNTKKRVDEFESM